MPEKKKMKNPPIGPRCEACHAVVPAQQRCSVCRLAWYCSKACQKRHYPMHKKLCQSATAASSSSPSNLATAVAAIACISCRQPTSRLCVRCQQDPVCSIACDQKVAQGPHRNHCLIPVPSVRKQTMKQILEDLGLDCGVQDVIQRYMVQTIQVESQLKHDQGIFMMPVVLSRGDDTYLVMHDILRDHLLFSIPGTASSVCISPSSALSSTPPSLFQVWFMGADKKNPNPSPVIRNVDHTAQIIIPEHLDPFNHVKCDMVCSLDGFVLAHSSHRRDGSVYIQVFATFDWSRRWKVDLAVGTQMGVMAVSRSLFAYLDKKQGHLYVLHMQQEEERILRRTTLCLDPQQIMAALCIDESNRRLIALYRSNQLECYSFPDFGTRPKQ